MDEIWMAYKVQNKLSVDIETKNLDSQCQSGEESQVARQEIS